MKATLRRSMIDLFFILAITLLCVGIKARVAEACGSWCSDPGWSCGDPNTCFMWSEYEGSNLDFSCCCSGYVCWWSTEQLDCASAVCSSDGEACDDPERCYI